MKGLRRTRYSVLVVLVWLLTCTASGANTQGVYKQFLAKPSSELYSTAKRIIDQGRLSSDTALVCLTIIYNRYTPQLPPEEQQRTQEACLRLWTIYFYGFYDYPKCFEYLSKAREIAKATGKYDPLIYLNLGAMYQTIAEESSNTDLNRKALGYYSQAFHTSYDNHDPHHADMAITNLLYVSHLLRMLPTVEPILKQYRHWQSSGLLYRYNLLLYDALRLLEKNDFNGAIAIYNKQLTLLGPTKEYRRLLYFTYINKVYAYRDLGLTDKALECMAEPEAIALSMNQKDLKLEVYTIFSDLYKAKGAQRQYNIYREKYILLKDTLTNYRQLASVSEMEFQSQLKEVGNEMQRLTHKHEVQQNIIIVGCIVSVVILLLLFVVFRQNRRLRQSNQQLYRQNVSLLKAEEQQRLMRQRTTVAEQPAQPQASDATEKKPGKAATHNDIDTELLERIRNVMENDNEICQSGFSVERLASLTDSKYKNVSQVIHEKFDCNFNTFLNEYRIKVACKRMNDLEHYGNYTIEAISSSVGFRSRTSFVTSFKRVTGLTPSEYQQLARKEKTK